MSKIVDNPVNLLSGMIRDSRAFEDPQARISDLTLQFTKEETLGMSHIPKPHFPVCKMGLVIVLRIAL